MSKPCPDGKERVNGKCLKVCPEGSRRYPKTGSCRKFLPCKDGKVRDPVSWRCRSAGKQRKTPKRRETKPKSPKRKETKSKTPRRQEAAAKSPRLELPSDLQGEYDRLKAENQELEAFLRAICNRIQARSSSARIPPRAERSKSKSTASARSKARGGSKRSASVHSKSSGSSKHSKQSGRSQDSEDSMTDDGFIVPDNDHENELKRIVDPPPRLIGTWVLDDNQALRDMMGAPGVKENPTLSHTLRDLASDPRKFGDHGAKSGWVHDFENIAGNVLAGYKADSAVQLLGSLPPTIGADKVARILARLRSPELSLYSSAAERLIERYKE